MNDVIVTRKELGNQLSEMRKESGVTKYRVSKTTGLKTDVVNAIENGSTSYTIDSLLKYVNGVGVEVVFKRK